MRCPLPVKRETFQSGFHPVRVRFSDGMCFSTLSREREQDSFALRKPEGVHPPAQERPARGVHRAIRRCGTYAKLVVIPIVVHAAPAGHTGCMVVIVARRTRPPVATLSPYVEARRPAYRFAAVLQRSAANTERLVIMAGSSLPLVYPGHSHVNYTAACAFLQVFSILFLAFPTLMVPAYVIVIDQKIH